MSCCHTYPTWRPFLVVGERCFRYVLHERVSTRWRVEVIDRCKGLKGIFWELFTSCTLYKMFKLDPIRFWSVDIPTFVSFKHSWFWAHLFRHFSFFLKCQPSFPVSSFIPSNKCNYHEFLLYNTCRWSYFKY